jgi:hypothetical protein
MSFIDSTPPRRPERKPWRGYTLDELRYQRMLVGARMLIERERLAQSVKGSGDSGTTTAGTFKTWMGYVDYAVTAISVLRSVRRIIKAWRN